MPRSLDQRETCCASHSPAHRRRSCDRLISSRQMLPTIEWKDDAIVMIDQRKLPGVRGLRHVQDGQGGRQGDQDDGHSRRAGDRRGGGDGHRARDAPQQGDRARSSSPPSSRRLCDLMAATRPTAVNLFWAIERMKRTFAAAAQGGGSVDEIKQRLEAEARRFTTRTSTAAGRWARTARRSCPTTARILTHCNAGALATAGYGTALGVIRAARRSRASRSPCSPTRRARSCRARG